MSSFLLILVAGTRLPMVGVHDDTIPLAGIVVLVFAMVPTCTIDVELADDGCTNLAADIRETTDGPDDMALMDPHPEHLKAVPFSQFVPPRYACWATGVCWGILTADRQALLMGSMASKDVHVSWNDYVAVDVG
jgi:hypothetical protein